MARYKLVKDEDGVTTGVVVNDGTHPELPQGASIPNDNNNRHWQEYLTWEESNDADAADSIDWMARLRSDRDMKLLAIDWRVMRNKTQLDNGDTPSDDATKMGEIRDYMQALRDFPANNPITDKAGYEALSWPSEPA